MLKWFWTIFSLGAPAVSGGSTVFKNTAENHDIIHIPVEFYNLYWLISAISVKDV